MTWKTLLPASLVATVLAIATIALATPPKASAQSACGGGAGKLCVKTCGTECPNGSCCLWTYYYYSKT